MSGKEVKGEGGIPNLSRNQLHAMQILWDAGEPLKPVEIEARFQWPIENATLRSVLRVLLERGEVSRTKSGRAFLYSPAIKKQNALSQLVSGLAEVFASGSRKGLVAQLLQDEALSPEDIEELKAIAASGRKKGDKS